MSTKEKNNAATIIGGGGHRERLRERFLKVGIKGFHDYEIVELLLTYAIPRRDVKPLAKLLIARFKGLRGVLDATIDELKSVKGIGENCAIHICLIKEVCAEYLKEKTAAKAVVRGAKDVVDYLHLKLSGEKVEKFLAVYMNTKNEILDFEVLHEGTIDQTIVYPRKAIERAFKHNARSIIFVHNHPSGDPTPSARDRELTRELINAAKGVDIVVHDHIIIGKSGYVSGKDMGWF
ncbi:MAG: DNA repair protein RadC [Deltaproteobacteria bacterium]|nr:DNA repair protein RadC [Deltaproteobacteria bacterium]